MIPVVITDHAESDLDHIVDYIAVDSPRRARSFVDELVAKAQRIGHMARAYPRRPDIAPDIRAAIHGHYLILFRIRQEVVEVLRIVHGARDLRGLLE